jgi:hypothetical protein
MPWDLIIALEVIWEFYSLLGLGCSHALAERSETPVGVSERRSTAVASLTRGSALNGNVWPALLASDFLIPEQSASTYSVSRSYRGQYGYPHVQSHYNQHRFQEPFPLLGYLNADQLSGHLQSTRKHRRLHIRAANYFNLPQRHGTARMADLCATPPTRYAPVCSPAPR